MFCSCPNSFGAEPNTSVCPVCMGYPGVLPVPNHEAIRRTVVAGMLTNCQIARFSKFDRKSYFYPDMPKNYQISQYDLPFCEHGYVEISGKGFSGAQMADKRIGITRIHLEEDVAKLTHFRSASGVDYNRAGVPLMETVSDPDMRSADEAYAYLTALKEIMQYGNLSDCDNEKGQMRCDVNISLRPVGTEPFGTKIELKNLNSFRAVHRAIEFEIERQAMLLDQGVVLRQETRGWNDDEGMTYLMRTKEEAHDYRYFPDPDLMPVTFTEEELAELASALPELPRAKRKRLVEECKLTEYDAEVITQDRNLSAYFEKLVTGVKTPKLAANWVITELLRELAARELTVTDSPVTAERLAGMLVLVENNTINGKIAKDVLTLLFEEDKDAETIVKERGWAQVNDAGAIAALVDEVIAACPTQVEEYKNGNPKVLQFLVGQCMKRSKGKANPPQVSALLAEKLQ